MFATPEYYGPWEEYKALSDEVSVQWINFIADGDPNGEGLPNWPTYNSTEFGADLVI